MTSFHVRRFVPFQILMKGQAFGAENQEDFLRDLRRLTGTTEADFGDITFGRGCVVFKAAFEEEAARLLGELFRKVHEGIQSESTLEVKAFMEKFQVTIMLSNYEVEARISIEARRRQYLSDDPQVIFIHGWRGDKDSFGILPIALEKRSNCKCLLYEYPTGTFSHSPSILYVAMNFNNWMRNHISSRNIAIIAHSMGGLVVRKFLVLQRDFNNPFDERVRLTTFVASPSDGSVLAKLATEVPGFRSDQVAELSPDSPLLFELNQQWTSWTSRHVPVHCVVRSIFGTKDSIVTPNNARGLDPQAVPILGAGHSDIIKPDSESAEIVLTIARFLQDAKLASSQPTQPGAIKTQSAT